MPRILAFAALLALAGTFPVAAQDADVDALRRHVQELRRQLQEMRQRLTQADDQMLDLARRFDQEKKRLQDEKEALLEENARLKRENAILAAKAGVKEGKEEDEKKQDEGLLARRMTLNFPDTPLTDVVAFLGDITQATVALDANIPAGATVTLRVRDQPMSKCLDLIAETCRTADGAPCPLKWRLKDGVIQVKKK